MPKDANRYKPVVPPAPPSVGKAALKAKLAATRTQKTDTVTVAIDGESITLELRKFKGRQNWALQKLGFASEDERGNRVMVPDQFYPLIIAYSYFVPGTDERMWTDDEVDEIGELDGDVVAELGRRAIDFAAMTKDAADETEKNSGAATAASSSTSPAS